MVDRLVWVISTKAFLFQQHNKIVSRFYITPVRHRLRLRRMPGGPARNAIAWRAKILSLFEFNGCYFLRSEIVSFMIDMTLPPLSRTIRCASFTSLTA